MDRVSTPTGLIEVGEIALVWTDCADRGWKRRPAVVAAVNGETVSIVPLTSAAEGLRGPRVRLNLPELHRPSYVWCPKLCLARVEDVEERVGWLDEDSLIALTRAVEMPGTALRRLQMAVFQRRRLGC